MKLFVPSYFRHVTGTCPAGSTHVKSNQRRPTCRSCLTSMSLCVWTHCVFVSRKSHLCLTSPWLLPYATCWSASLTQLTLPPTVTRSCTSCTLCLQPCGRLVAPCSKIRYCTYLHGELLLMIRFIFNNSQKTLQKEKIFLFSMVIFLANRCMQTRLHRYASRYSKVVCG